MSAPLTHPPLVAGGNVTPCRFITVQTGGSNIGSVAIQVASTAGTVPVVGVSAEATRYPPGGPSDDTYIAVSGEPLPYHGAGEIANVTLGGTIDNSNINLPVMSDNTGKAVTTSGAAVGLKYAAGFPLKDGVSGDKIPVWIFPMMFNTAVS